MTGAKPDAMLNVPGDCRTATEPMPMCCAIALLGIIGPRVLIVIWWLTDPARWALTFNNQVLLPAVGFVFLPWTTFLYVLSWTTAGLSTLGWLLVGLGVLLDLGTYGGGVFGNREKVQSYYRQ
jgi:hypothetical protein